MQLSRLNSYSIKASVLTLVLVFTGCNKDYLGDSFQSHRNLQSFSVNGITYADISKNRALHNKIGDIKRITESINNSGASRTVTEEYYDFNIVMDYANYIVDGDYHSYTFKVYREEDNGLLENLVLSSRDDGTYSARLYQYDLDDSYDGTLISNDNIKTYTMVLLDDEFSNSIFSRNSDPCVYEFWGSPNSPDMWSSEQECETNNGEDCEVIYTVVNPNCNNVTEGGSGGSYSWGAYSSVVLLSFSPDSGEYYETWNPFDEVSIPAGGEECQFYDANGNCVGDEITTPLNEVIEVSKLKQQTSDFGVRARIVQMQNDLNTATKEQGSEFRKSGFTYTEFVVPTTETEFDYVHFPVAIATSEIRIHTHHNFTNSEGQKLATVFSLDDILGVINFLIEKTETGVIMPPGGNISSILVSRRGLYALRITDTAKALQFLSDFNDPDKVNSSGQTFRDFVKETFALDVIKKTTDQCTATNCSDEQEAALFELYFIEFFKRLDSGLSLYFADEIDEYNNYNWEYITN